MANAPIIGGVKKGKIPEQLYHTIQLELTYNSNRIEGNRLRADQVRDIYEQNVIYPTTDVVNVDDIVETVDIRLIIIMHQKYRGRTLLMPCRA